MSQNRMVLQIACHINPVKTYSLAPHFANTTESIQSIPSVTHETSEMIIVLKNKI